MDEKELEKLARASYHNEPRIKMIVNHELFTELLSGNPQSISLAAQCFKIANADPERKNKNNLLDLYTQLKKKIEKEKSEN